MGLAVLVPSSLTLETEDRRIATYKVGQVARAAAIYRCDTVVVYDDEPSDESVNLILRYAATPPYLRKELFEVRDELGYVGVIPPLRIPPHTVGSEGNAFEPYREGVVTKVGSDGRVWVNCGMQHPVALRVPNKGIREGERVTLRISSREPLKAEVVPESEVPHYNGYNVEEASLLDWLADFDGSTVMTSRQGEKARSEHLDKDDLALVFGSPERDVREILRDHYDASTDFDAVVNTIPNQGTETVRTEEAVLATLAVRNTLRA